MKNRKIHTAMLAWEQYAYDKRTHGIFIRSYRKERLAGVRSGLSFFWYTAHETSIITRQIEKEYK